MAIIRGVGGLGGTNSEYLGGSSPIQREFLFEGFVVGAFPQTLADSGGGVLDRGVAPIYPSDGEGVLFLVQVRTHVVGAREQGRSRRVGRDRGSDVYHRMIDQRR